MRKAVLTLVAPLALVAACASDGDVGTAGTTSSAPAAASTDAPTTPAPPTAATSTGPATTVAPYLSAVYADLAHWICHPDLAADPCDGNLAATEVAADGTLTVQPYAVAADPAVDCFYAYPTSSEDATLTSDLVPGQEVGVTRAQVGRYAQVCRLFAPVYPSVTLAGLFGQAGGDRAAAFDIASEGVEDAFRHYLANHSDGRGFVLVGHSQGAGLLNRLVSDVIDPDPALRARLVSAIIVGSAVAVPDGADVGGDFENVPLCRAPDQTGCAVTYASFRSTAPPPANSFFGRPRTGTGVAGCTNPAALAGGEAELRPVYEAGSWVFAEPATAPPLTTPFVALPGLARAECVIRDGFSFLEIRVQPGEGPRTDDVRGDLSPEWGLHLADMNLAQDDLIALVGSQAAAYTSR